MSEKVPAEAGWFLEEQQGADRATLLGRRAWVTCRTIRPFNRAATKMFQRLLGSGFISREFINEFLKQKHDVIADDHYGILHYQFTSKKSKLSCISGSLLLTPEAARYVQISMQYGDRGHQLH